MSSVPRADQKLEPARGGARETKRRCLVTGASGFLGRRVVSRLVREGIQVTAQLRSCDVALPGVEARWGDMTAPGWAEATRTEWRWDCVVHLAGPVSSGAGVTVDEARVARQHALLALALARSIPHDWRGRLIHASSMTVYGIAPKLPVPETQELAPTFLYALGKVLAEDVWKATELDDVWLLRFPGLFALERRSGALFHFINAALEHRPITISAREPTLWDILHVDDAAEAIARALSSPQPFVGAINVSYGEVVSLERVALRVAELTTHVGVVNETEVRHPDFQLDITRARERLRWPPCTLESRIEQLIATMRAEHA